MEQPSSPLEMNKTVTEQPEAAQSMDVHMRGGGAGEAVLVSAALSAASAAVEIVAVMMDHLVLQDPPGGRPPGW
ncbi:uncharacterized protein N7469_007811 [Penicillium citrinum]|uniref:Uncharacterized protein n=1 Tax=Penicillium citrinum TaxID=5077 RepID=A0A9W9NR10_PENCI|nr:uncharacterized protein N7469_007811 [Penicillium citrinum]KAJ5224308.1 hypothetical protein N7469_007811 [Penicillium citrinum]